MTPSPTPSRPTVPAWMLAPERPSPAAARRRTAALVAAVALLSGGVGGAVGAASAEDDSVVVPSRPDAVATSLSSEDGTAGVAARVLPSVVSIAVRSAGGSGTGSGVVIDDAGHVLTNNHVVESGVDGEVAVMLQDGSRRPARIVGLDPVTDLAVLEVADRTGLRPVELGRSGDVRVGDPVVAIGSPLGLSGTVTTGIVSALGRTVPTDPETPLLGALQTDAAINPGNSGGALVDAQGRLIGINTAISTQGGGGSIGLGFAIPVDQARSVADELIRTGRAVHPWLGVAGTAVVSDDDRRGVRLEQVAPGSAADDAGLEPADVVVGVAGTPVGDVDELVLALRRHDVGEQVEIRYLRGGAERSAQVVLAERET